MTIRKSLACFAMPTVVLILTVGPLPAQDITKNQNNTAANTAEVNKTTVRKTLEDIANNDESYNNRINAILKLYGLDKISTRKIKNEKYLTDIAIHCSDFDIVISAINKLKNQDNLLQIINSGNYTAAIFALEKYDVENGYNEVIKIVDSNSNSIFEGQRALASFGAMRLLEYENTLKKYNGYSDHIRVDVSIRNQKYNEGIFYWLQWNVLVSENSIVTHYVFDDEHLAETTVPTSELNKMHFSVPDMDWICSDLLRTISIEDLKTISDNSDVSYLRKAANKILRELESENPPVRPLQNNASTEFKSLTNAMKGCHFVYRFIKGNNDYYTRLEIELGSWLLKNFSFEAGTAIQYVLENGDVVSLYNPREISNNTARGMDFFLRIENEDMERLSKFRVQKLKIFTASELIEKEIDVKRSQVFKEMAREIMTK